MIRFAAVLIGVLLSCLLLLVAEFAVRTFTELTFLGSSSDLFVQHQFGSSVGHRPKHVGIVFGIEVHTDERGFRIPHVGYTYPYPYRQRIMILGDSVAFGNGVYEQQSFVGQFRDTHPDIAVYNTAVMRYALDDYVNVAKTLLAGGKRFDQAILIYCLNDVSQDSAKLLQSAGVPQFFSWWERLRSNQLASDLDEWLRAHSKLYLLVKGWTTDPQARFFLADYLNYDDGIEQKMAPLAELAEILRKTKIPLTVFVAPYEYQLRTDHPLVSDVWKPQRLVLDYLQRHGIHAVDGRTLFTGQDGSAYFLPFDPMHFSVRGHGRVAQWLSETTANPRSPGESSRGNQYPA